jgi:phytanoyl-CoA hydroxylase
MIMSKKEVFETDGYYVAEGMFSPQEIALYREHFEGLRVANAPADVSFRSETDNDPLKIYPRLMHPHRHDKVSMDFLCDPRIDETITELTGFSPFAVQTMFYFKPAGARGQALHQDNFYLKASPSTCIAAWLAVDDCDIENGCLQVVPGSHETPVLCLVPSDTTVSFTDVEVPLPEGISAKNIIMKAGDVLFFNGQAIHGSGPNTSKDRFRRSLIAHYVLGDCTSIGKYYHPVMRMDRSVVEMDINEGGGKCGEWVNIDGRHEIEMVDSGTQELSTVH